MEINPLLWGGKLKKNHHVALMKSKAVDSKIMP
jgi:hypothetical protein